MGEHDTGMASARGRALCLTQGRPWTVQSGMHGDARAVVSEVLLAREADLVGNCSCVTVHSTLAVGEVRGLPCVTKISVAWACGTGACAPEAFLRAKCWLTSLGTTAGRSQRVAVDVCLLGPLSRLGRLRPIATEVSPLPAVGQFGGAWESCRRNRPAGPLEHVHFEWLLPAQSRQRRMNRVSWHISASPDCARLARSSSLSSVACAMLGAQPHDSATHLLHVFSGVACNLEGTAQPTFSSAPLFGTGPISMCTAPFSLRQPP